MVKIKNINNVNYLILDNERVFLSSEKINIFPCSRRGSEGIEDISVPGSAKYYDPEARLNTERTNRIGIAINGFTDSFIDSFTKDKDAQGNELETGTLVFALAGYRVEVKDFDPADIAAALSITTGTICAHLSLHDNISLNVEDYFTEILYRQLTGDNTKNKKYLDISYTAPDSEDEKATRTDDFFVGISFTTKEVKDTLTETRNNGTTTRQLPSHLLSIFVESGGTWEPVQTSILPKIEHGETEDSIKIKGDFTVEHGEQNSFKVTENETTLTNDFKIKRVSAEGEQTSFEITKHGVGTVNVPLHITTAVSIDGLTTMGPAHAFSLFVGETYPDTISQGTITADYQVNTPTLEVNTITSNSKEGIVVDKDLTISDSTLTVTGDTQLQTVTVNGLVDNEYTNLNKGLAVKGDATIEGLTKANDIDAAKITANEIWLDTVDTESIGQVPALELAQLTDDSYQLRFKFGTPLKIKDERPKPTE